MSHKKTIYCVATVAFLLTIRRRLRLLKLHPESLATTTSRLRMTRGILRLPDKTSFRGAIPEPFETVWQKTRYIEYTDGTFRFRKPQPDCSACWPDHPRRSRGHGIRPFPQPQHSADHTACIRTVFAMTKTTRARTTTCLPARSGNPARQQLQLHLGWPTRIAAPPRRIPALSAGGTILTSTSLRDQPGDR